MQSSTLYTPDICYIPPTTTEVVKLFNNYLLFPAFLTDFFLFSVYVVDLAIRNMESGRNKLLPTELCNLCTDQKIKSLLFPIHFH